MTGSRITTRKQVQTDRHSGKLIVFLFNGQGSQYYHMARALYQQHDSFRQTLEYLDRLVQQHIGDSMLSVMYDSQQDIGKPFSELRFTHSAIFCVQYALAKLLCKAGWVPDYVLGMSLGEFVAATISGAMEPESALEAVLKQALVIEQSCPPGGMLAILSSVEYFTEHPEIFSGSELAGINYDEHFVIACEAGSLERIQAILRQRGVLHLTLPVDFGFHSALIDPAARTYLDYLARLQMKEPAIPVVSCQTGTELAAYGRNHFWQVVRNPMRFSATLHWFENQVSEGRGVIYIDLGPGGTLANFIKRSIDARSASSYQSIITPFHQEVARLKEVEQCLQNNLKRG